MIWNKLQLGHFGSVTGASLTALCTVLVVFCEGGSGVVVVTCIVRPIAHILQPYVIPVFHMCTYTHPEVLQRVILKVLRTLASVDSLARVDSHVCSTQQQQ